MSNPKNDVLSLAAQLGKYEGKPSQLPPIQEWHPKLSGDMDMVIKADGRWEHEGDEIKREKLVRLFSTILRREGDEFFLVTPVEKWRIKVEGAPFQAVLADIDESYDVEGGRNIRLLTNAGDEVTLGSDHILELDDSSGLPLIEIRGGLKAQLGRNVYYQLAELAEERAEGFFLKSGGQLHRIG